MSIKQDMPPQGGYAPITYKRVPLKPGWGALTKFTALFCTTGVGLAALHYTKNKLNREAIEMRCADQAINPMLLAEFDRLFLKQIRKNRDYEEELMKDVKGWEVGKWKHMPVYLSLDPDEYFKCHFAEYFVHGDYNVGKVVGSYRFFN